MRMATLGFLDSCCGTEAVCVSSTTTSRTVSVTSTFGSSGFVLRPVPRGIWVGLAVTFELVVVVVTCVGRSSFSIEVHD